MACDICGKTGVWLEQIRDIYKTDDIQSTCHECTKVLNGRLDSIKKSQWKATESLFKRFMRNMKEKP